jgi:hypothetical protein
MFVMKSLLRGTSKLFFVSAPSIAVCYEQRKNHRNGDKKTENLLPRRTVDTGPNRSLAFRHFRTKCTRSPVEIASIWGVASNSRFASEEGDQFGGKN